MQTCESAFRNMKPIAECLADKFINAAKGSSNSYAIKVCTFHIIAKDCQIDHFAPIERGRARSSGVAKSNQ
jgi:hypothetical protein